MTIGEVGRRSGLAPSAIRYYEDAGLLPRPPRIGGRRSYDPSILERLAVLDRAKACGFTLAETRFLFNGFRPGTPPSERWEAMARKKLVELDELQAKIAGMQVLLRRRCRCRDLAECGKRILAARKLP